MFFLAEGLVCLDVADVLVEEVKHGKMAWWYCTSQVV